MHKLLVLSGPNLNRLGKREPEIYGRQTLSELHHQVEEAASNSGVEVECRQSNHEGELIDWIGEAKDVGFSAIVINPGALTHYSYALYDSLLAASLPCVEVHLSNPEAREEFRHKSCTAAACVGKVAGFGVQSYTLAVQALASRLGA